MEFNFEMNEIESLEDFSNYLQNLDFKNLSDLAINF